jgi:hypothetical protein
MASLACLSCLKCKFSLPQLDSWPRSSLAPNQGVDRKPAQAWRVGLWPDESKVTVVKPPIVLPLVTVAAGIGGALFSRTTVDFKSDGPLFGADLPPKTYGPPVASAPCAWKTSWPDQAQLC